jgi:hypothetical protein
MADNIVGGLFGMLPEDLTAQRIASLDQQAMAFGRLSGKEGTRALAYKAGNVLGQGVAQGLFGLEDPQMARIKQRQQMAQGIDFNDPESLLQAAQRANQMGDTQAAQGLFAKAQEVAQAQALLNKTNAEAQKASREQAGADPIQQLIRTGKYTPESVSAFAQSRDPSDLVAIDNLTKPTADFIAIAVQLGFGDKPSYGGYTPEQVAKVNEALFSEQTKLRTAGSPKIVNELKQAPDITKAIGAFDELVKPYRETLNSTENAQQLLNEAARSKNSQAFEAARTTLAKAIGENKLSNEDIRRTGIDPRLVQGALDWVNKKIEGVPNEDIIKQMYAVSTALRNKSAERINEQARRTREAAKASGFTGDLDLYFPTVKVNIPPIRNGGYSDPAKEKRFQDYKRAQGQ